MTTEKVVETEQGTADTQEMEAAFGAGFNDQPVEAPKPAAATDEQATKETAEAVKEQEAAPPAPSPTPAPAPAVDYGVELRKLQGQYGALNDLLRQTLKTKEAEGKPAVLTAFELKRMQAAYPELAGDLQEDIKEALATLTPKAVDPKEIDDLVDTRVAAALKNNRIEEGIEAMTDAHPNWLNDLWVDGRQGGTRTPEYVAWLKSIPESEAKAFEASDRIHRVIKGIGQFYDWKAKETQAKTEKDDRLKAALTPKGVPRTGQSTLSDEEAMNKGFAEGFNS